MSISSNSKVRPVHNCLTLGPPPGQPRDDNVCYLYSGNDAEDEMQRVGVKRRKLIAGSSCSRKGATRGHAKRRD